MGGHAPDRSIDRACAYACAFFFFFFFFFSLSLSWLSSSCRLYRLRHPRVWAGHLVVHLLLRQSKLRVRRSTAIWIWVLMWISISSSISILIWTWTWISPQNIPAFAVFYTLANVCALAGTGFLMGFIRQFHRMFKKERWIPSTLYLTFIVLTLVFAFLRVVGRGRKRARQAGMDRVDVLIVRCVCLFCSLAQPW